MARWIIACRDKNTIIYKTGGEILEKNYTQESFEEWLKEIPSKLKTLAEDFSSETKLTLNYSLKSLDDLEQWLLKNYDVATDLRDEEELLDMLGIYVGETYMKYIGGVWYVELENDKSVFYKHIVMLHNEEGEQNYRSARALCTSCISRKRGNLLRLTLEKSIEILKG